MNNVVTIVAAGKPLVTIANDGQITYGEGYEPDAAALVFWGAITRNMPLMPLIVRAETWDLANRYCSDLRGPLSVAEQHQVCRALLDATYLAGQIA